MQNEQKAIVYLIEWEEELSDAEVVDLEKLIQENLEKQQEKVELLRLYLARNQGLRYKDFNAITENMWKRCRQKETEIAIALKRFCTEEKNIRDQLSICLNDIETTEKFESLRQQIRDLALLHNELKKELRKALVEYYAEQEEIEIALEELLSNREALKIPEFKLVIKHLESIWKLKERYFSNLCPKIRLSDGEFKNL